jgi:hypothetical protein
MARLLELVEKHLGESWLDVVRHLRDVNGLGEIAARIEASDVEGAIRGVEDAAAKFAADEHAAYIQSGRTAAASLDSEVEGALVRFDGTNDRAVRWAERNTLDKVREITGEQRDLIRRVIADGVREGRNPREVARDLRDSIGLTDYQSQIVANYRRALEQGDFSNALGRELTDGRDDRGVAAAQRAGTPLPAERIDGMVERYRSNMVAYRAEMLARTEALRVAHQGTREAFQQAVDRGHVEADALERQWHHSSGGKDPRPEHRAMNGQRRGLDEPFTSGSGAELMFPGDPSADASETAGCRCAVSTRLVA